MLLRGDDVENGATDEHYSIAASFIQSPWGETQQR